MAGSERPDPELHEIRRLYAQLAAMQFSGGSNRQTPAYHDLLVRIRALVDARTKIRGDEMIVIANKSEPW